MTHTPIDRLGYPADTNNAPEMLAHLLLFLAGFAAGAVLIVAGLVVVAAFA